MIYGKTESKNGKIKYDKIWMTSLEEYNSMLRFCKQTNTKSSRVASLLKMSV